jgi:prepilin-type N-terminal cleavage/methylation domain-containing protein
VRTRNGYTLIELLIVVAIIGLFVGIVAPAWVTMQRRAALRNASGQLRGIFNLARSRAAMRGMSSGVKFFEAGGEWRFAIYDDGDGDGVRNDDIDRRVDRRVTLPRRVLPESGIVSIGLLRRTIKDPDGDRLLPTQSPVHFNRSTICSFSPLGQSTPGTIYITDRDEQLFAVRVWGTTARVRTLRYDAASRRWVAR